MECTLKNLLLDAGNNPSYEIIKELLHVDDSVCKKIISIVPKSLTDQDTNDIHRTYLLIGSYIVCPDVNNSGMGFTRREIELYRIHEIRSHIRIEVSDAYVTAKLTDDLKLKVLHENKEELYDFIRSILAIK